MRELAILFLVAASAWGACTQISDTILTFDGSSKFDGHITISGPAMTTASGETVERWKKTWDVAAGVFSACIQPNDTATPSGTSYAVRYLPRTAANGLDWPEVWVVPTSNAALKIKDVRVLTVPTPSLSVLPAQISSGGAAIGQAMLWSGTAWGPGAVSAAQLQGRAVASTAPTDMQALVWDAAAAMWKPSTAEGPAGPAGPQGPAGAMGPAGPNQSGTANQVVATPDGAPGTATPRALVRADMPSSVVQKDASTGGVALAAMVPLDAPANSIVLSGNLYPGVPQTGLLADYRFTDGSGTALKDYSSNANHGTLASGANAPTWVTGGLQGSITTAKWVDLPSTLNSAQTIIVAANFPLATQANGIALAQPIIWGPSVSGGPAMYMHQSSINGWYGVTRPGVITAGSYSTGAYDNIAGTHALAVVYGSGSPKDQIYVDGVPASTYGKQDSNLGLMVSGNYRLGSGVTGLGTGKFPGTFYRALFYSRQLSAAEMASVSAAITSDLTVRGVAVNASPKPLSKVDNRLIAIGDSITAGAGGTPYTSLLSLSDTFTVINGGANGQYASDMEATFTWGLRASASSGTKQVCVILGGANEIGAAGGPTSADTAGLVFRTSRACRAAGLKSVIVTLPSEGGKETQRRAVNDIFRQQWPSHADGLADAAAHPLLGADGASSNSTYFADVLHPNATGNQILANVISLAVNSVFGNTLAAGTPNTATGTYSMLGGDVYLLANPSGGNVTINAVTAVGITGQIRCVKNVQTSGANMVTFTPVSDETVDGSASVLIANKSQACFQSFLVSATAGGASWRQVK